MEKPEKYTANKRQLPCHTKFNTTLYGFQLSFTFQNYTQGASQQADWLWLGNFLVGDHMWLVGLRYCLAQRRWFVNAVSSLIRWNIVQALFHTGFLWGRVITPVELAHSCLNVTLLRQVGPGCFLYNTSWPTILRLRFFSVMLDAYCSNRDVNYIILGRSAYQTFKNYNRL